MSTHSTPVPSTTLSSFFRPARNKCMRACVSRPADRSNPSSKRLDAPPTIGSNRCVCRLRLQQTSTSGPAPAAKDLMTADPARKHPNPDLILTHPVVPTPTRTPTHRPRDRKAAGQGRKHEAQGPVVPKCQSSVLCVCSCGSRRARSDDALLCMALCGRMID